MRIEKIACDVCKIEKKETNHWFIVSLSNDLDEAHIGPLDSHTPFAYQYDTCGLPCTFKLISEKLKVEVPLPDLSKSKK